MKYLNEFKFLDRYDEDCFRNSINLTCYDSFYPFGILSKNEIEDIEFEPITIFYGGNGCGKTTALNIIAEKLNLQRDTLYNKTNFFDNYLNYCEYESIKIPHKSRIITSDDVFDFTMNLRYLNEGLNNRREELFDEYDEMKYSSFKMSSLEDYDNFKKNISAKRASKSQFVRQNMQNNLREHSNGESAYIYFTNKIENNALYLLDEPENSLSPEKQRELVQYIQDSVRFYACQFIIATHSPFLLSLKEAKIYDFDECPLITKKWTELENVKEYYKFFKLHEKEFV